MDDRPSIQTTEEFQRQVEALITEAVRNDVNVLGGWAATDSVENTDYEALVTQVSKRR